MTDPTDTYRPEGLGALFDAATEAATGVVFADIVDAANRRRDHIVVAPIGYQIQRTPVDPEFGADRPFHRRGKTVLRTAAAVSAYAAQRGYQVAQTGLYYEPETMTAEVIFDDHAAILTDPDADEVINPAGWRRDRARLELGATPSWDRWSKANRRMLDQETFANLVEDGLGDIIDPDAADLLDMVQTMQGTVGANWRASHRNRDGQVQVSYVENVETRAGADGTLTVPQSITLRVAPFLGADPLEVNARLRTRVTGANLHIGIIIDRLEELLIDTVEREVAKIAVDLGVTAVCVAGGYPAPLTRTPDQ